MMQTEAVLARLKRQHWMQGVFVEFREDGQPGLRFLMNHPSVTIDDRDMAVASAVIESNEWDRPANRKVHFHIAALAPLEVIAEGIAVHIKTISITTDHALKALCTGRREKMRDEAAKLKTGFLADVIKEIEDFGLTITAELYVRKKNMPVIVVEVFDGDAIVCTIFLDGWSGRLEFPDGTLSDEEATPELISETLMDIVDAHTAPRV